MIEEKKNFYNNFILEGNVGNIGDIYQNKNGKKSLRFDLGQNSNDDVQFIPIVIKGKLVDTYGNDIKTGDWIRISGRINAYIKEIKKNDKTYMEKITEIIGFEITNKENNKIYSSNGEITTKEQKEDMER